MAIADAAPARHARALLCLAVGLARLSYCAAHMRRVLDAAAFVEAHRDAPLLDPSAYASDCDPSGHVVQSVDATSDYADAEQKARLEATAQNLETTKRLLGLKTKELEKRVESAKKHGSIAASTKANMDSQNASATAALKAARSVRVRAAQERAKMEATRAASVIISGVASEELEKAKKAVGDVSVDAIQAVANSSVAMAQRMAQETSARSAAEHAKAQVAHIEEDVSVGGESLKVATAAASAASQKAAELQRRAAKSAKAAQEAEAGAEADRARAEHAVASLEALIAESKAKHDVAKQREANAAAELAAMATSVGVRAQEASENSTKSVLASTQHMLQTPLRK
eukprot:CAMPEP_0117525776 /NCGR_PEP_ID=MMETSP0784-20121206/35946_1 /TAXON_ID=39447 /ORGANISM="" /LENGTH=343 /DNA_ID=CAMNT_0005321987 /DNA_START=53 /DNA_END=1084 /DNA_ORIENTATION=+